MDRLYSLAEFAEAGRIFDSAGTSHPPYITILKRARIYVKGDSAAAIRFLVDRPAPKSAAAQEAERHMILGMAYGRIGDHKIAGKHFLVARQNAKTAKDREIESEIAYWEARDKVLQGDLKGAEATLPEVAKSSSRIASVRFLDLQSIIQGRRQCYRDQSRTLIALIDLISEGRQDVPEFRIWAVHTLAVLAREIEIPEARPVLVAEIAKPWPRFFQENRFQSEKGLAWISALQGDYFNAFRYLKSATATAPSDAWKMMALLDRAYLAKCTGETLWSRQELAEAEEVCARIDWRLVDGEERVALLLFCEMFATIDKGKAAYYLAQFGKFGSVNDPLLNFAAKDDRLRALADYVHGVVDLELGHRKHGLRALRNAFSIFDRIGFDWRAGRTAMRIYDVTHEPIMLANAREKLRSYMSSWLGQDLTERLKGGTGLTPMQDRIFRELCQGFSTSEIASRLQRSEFTVRNHLKLVFTAFGVKSRTALLAEASRRGLMP